MDALGDNLWDDAWAMYAEGGNSVKGEGYRTIRGFSKDLTGEAAYDEQVAYWGDLRYADDLIRGAMWTRLNAESSAKDEARPDYHKGTQLTDAMVQQLVKKEAVYMHTWIYSLHELYSAVSKCKAGNIDIDSGAPHAWDEGWAFYAGGLAGTDGKDGGVLTYALADKRCGDFGTRATVSMLP